MNDEGPSMSDKAVMGLFACLAQASVGKCGQMDVDASNPDGVQTITVLAVDESVFLRALGPALKAAGIEVVRVHRREGV